MAIEILRKQPLTFYTQNGINFFKPFRAVDKNKNPLELSWNHKPDFSSITAKSKYNDDISIYNIKIDKSKNDFKGDSIVTTPKNKGIGEVLNLASIITFKENNFVDYSVFALRNAIQFYAKYGFNLLSSNFNEIMHNLKFLTKLKDERYIDTRESAKFLINKVHQAPNDAEKMKYIPTANNLVSDYIRNLAREGKKIDGDDLYNHTHMHFSTIDTIRNRDYLNELLDKHEINYTL